MLVLDANILIRAVLGSRVLSLIRRYSDHTAFVSPDTAFQEARENLPAILHKRKVPLAPATEAMELLAQIVQTVDFETYAPFEALARQRIDRRSRRLANPCDGAGVELPNLDRRYRLLWLWRRNLDNGPGGSCF